MFRPNVTPGRRRRGAVGRAAELCHLAGWGACGRPGEPTRVAAGAQIMVSLCGVTPAKVLAFGKNPYSQTRYRFASW